MRSAVIVSTARTGIGRAYRGAFNDMPSPTLAGHAIRAAVERTDDDQPPWHPEQRITVAEALAASTRGRAEPHVGDVADLVLIDLPPERMTVDHVAATLVGGRFTHRAL